MKRSAWFVVLLVGLSVAAHGDVTDDQRDAVSNQMASQMEQAMGPITPVPPEQRASQVFNSLLAYTQRRDVNYRLEVVQSRTVNAYALPNGRIVMYSNLLNHIANDPNALAFVESHEISHVEYHHADKKIQEQLGTGLVLGLAVRRSNLTTQLAALATHQLFASGYSRQLEAEADRHGLELMRRAGYDPNGALVVFKMFEDMESKGMRVFPNHPRAVDRYANTIAWLNENHIAIHPPGTAYNPPPPAFAPPAGHVGGPQFASGNVTPSSLPLPAVNYGSTSTSLLQQGFYDPAFEKALSNEIMSRTGNSMVVDSKLSQMARNRTGEPIQSHVEGNKVVMVAMIPAQWLFADWKADFDRQFLTYMQQYQGTYDAVGVACKVNSAGTKQVVMVLGHLMH